MSARIDASTFDPARVSQAVLDFNTALVTGMAGGGWVFPPPSAPALRDALATSAPPPYVSVSARTITVPAGTHEIPVRIIPAATPTAVFVHVHGGGWAIGSAAGQDAALERIATATGMTVASVDYRLAPEHPYPAGLDDCERATRWLIEHAAAELGSGRLLIGGESAGANLALCTALRVVADQPDALRGAALYYGNYDVTMTPSQRRAESGVLITTGSLAWFYDQYVPDASRRADPDISPLYADLRGLPPVVLAVGTADSLVDDTMFLASRLLAAGVDTELVVVPGGEHAFDMAPVPECQQAVTAVDAFLAKHAAG
ncbi:MAG: alpha/beta hydrolase [Trebonia sp.]